MSLRTPTEEDYERLEEACENFDEEGVQALCSEVAVNLNRACGYIQGTVLHIAAETDAAELALVLIREGADVEAKDRYGSTALHMAAEKGYEDVVQVLLEEGANTEAKTKTRTTPLHFAAERNHYFVVRMLLAAGACVNALDNDEQTPLHKAVYMDHTSIALALVSAGADMEAMDEEEYFPSELSFDEAHRAIDGLFLTGLDFPPRSKRRLNQGRVWMPGIFTTNKYRRRSLRGKMWRKKGRRTTSKVPRIILGGR